MLVLLFGAFLALGMASVAVQAGEMAAKMALASDSGTTGQDGCKGCGDEGGASADSCQLGCTAASFALLPSGSTVSNVGESVTFVTAGSIFLGAAPPPDPFPPRSFDAG